MTCCWQQHFNLGKQQFATAKKLKLNLNVLVTTLANKKENKEEIISLESEFRESRYFPNSESLTSAPKSFLTFSHSNFHSHVQQNAHNITVLKGGQRCNTIC